MSIEDRSLMPGAVLVARYKKAQHRCEVVKGEDGRLAFRVGGKEYGSPSAAGSAVMDGVSCNGWRFWTPDSQQYSKKTAARAKPAGKARAKGIAKPGKVAGGGNGEAPTPVEKPVSCGDCRQEFPTAHEAANHMRDVHGSVEAGGVGG